MPWSRPGPFSLRGVGPLDLATEYVSETGIPLLTAEQVASLCGVKRGTVDLWVHRKRISVSGLTEDGLYLFNAGHAAALIPSRRRRAAA
jgi:hypothetical protein